MTGILKKLTVVLQARRLPNPPNRMRQLWLHGYVALIDSKVRYKSQTLNVVTQLLLKLLTIKHESLLQTELKTPRSESERSEADDVCEQRHDRSR